MARYLIIGAGAIGGSIGARLFQNGHQVVLVARGDHLGALREDGLRLRTPDEDVRLHIPAVGSPDEVELTPGDVLVLTTKTQQAQAALARWADSPLTGGGTAGERLPMLTATNGVASETFALRYFARVYAVCVWMPSVHLVPGEVIIRAVPNSGVFHVGRVPVGLADDDDRAFLTDLAGEWSGARLTTALPPDVMAWKYRKLLSNIGNVFQALVGSNSDSYRGVKAAADAEARSVLEEAGLSYIGDVEERAARRNSFRIEPVPGVPDEAGGSTWQSLARGTGNVETDYLNGEIVLLAHSLGRTAPINAGLAALARRAALGGQRPGAISAEELPRLLGLTAAQ